MPLIDLQWGKKIDGGSQGSANKPEALGGSAKSHVDSHLNGTDEKGEVGSASMSPKSTSAPGVSLGLEQPAGEGRPVGRLGKWAYHYLNH